MDITIKNKVLRAPKAILYALLIVAVIIVTCFFVPGSVLPKRSLFPVLAILAIVFTFLGATLVCLTIILKIRGMLRLFLILTGASAVGFLVSVVLHNLVYGLFIYFFGEDFWDRIGMMDEPFFFCLAIFVCPVLFLVGSLGSIVLFTWTKQKPDIKQL
jgi:hypothetical protein